jgi:hypothetical protein
MTEDARRSALLAVLLATAVAVGGACSDSSSPSGVSCSTKSKCSSEGTIGTTECKTRLASATCGAAYQSYLDCWAKNETCTSAGKADTSALATVCKSTLAAWTSCTTPDSGTYDVGGGGEPANDLSVLADHPRDAAKKKCGTNCEDLVLDSLTLPTTSTLTSLSYDFDGDGKLDNALGQILATLGAAFSGLATQEALDEAIATGASLTLVRITAKSFTTDPSAKMQVWSGQSEVCCAGAVDAGTFDITTCQSQATQASGCFGGSYTFKPASTTTTYVLSGKITSGALAFGPGSLPIQISFATGTSMALTLKGARVSGTLTSSGKIKSGVLVGGISTTEIDNVVLPAIASLLTTTYKTTTDPTTKATLKAFDTDGDGTITGSELKSNALIGTLMSPDVDVDSDGNMELSLGVAFTAVGAEIDAT